MFELLKTTFREENLNCLDDINYNLWTNIVGGYQSAVWDYTLKIKFDYKAKSTLIDAGVFSLFDDLIHADQKCRLPCTFNDIIIYQEAIDNSGNITRYTSAYIVDNDTIEYDNHLSSWSSLDIWDIKDCEYYLNIESRTSYAFVSFLDKLELLPESIRDILQINGYMVWSDNDPNRYGYFSYGYKHSLEVITAADNPPESKFWKKDKIIECDLFTLNLICYGETTSEKDWGKIIPHAMQVAALNSDSQKRSTLYECTTDSIEIEKAVEYLNEMAFDFNPCFDMKKEDRHTFKIALLNLIKAQINADQDKIDSTFNDIVFENKEFNLIEQWIYNKDIHDFDIYQARITDN